jgi:hypothetical protein
MNRGMSALSVEPPPEGGIIKLVESQEGLKLSWPNQIASLRGMIASGIYLVGWLGMWTVMGLALIYGLVTGFKDVTIFQKAFLSFWLVGWLVGEIFAIKAMITLFLPARPEHLILGNEAVMHDPGRDQNASWWSPRKKGRENNVAKPKKRELFRTEVQNVRIDRIGERQRLSIDIGAERVEIGRNLQEPEREWLYDVLCRWKES